MRRLCRLCHSMMGSYEDMRNKEVLLVVYNELGNGQMQSDTRIESCCNSEYLAGVDNSSSSYVD